MHLNNCFQYDDFLVLPEEVNLDEAKAVLDKLPADNVETNIDNNTSLQQPTSTNLLKLRKSTGMVDISYLMFYFKILIDMSFALILSISIYHLYIDSSMFDESRKADMTLLSYMKEMGKNNYKIIALLSQITIIFNGKGARFAHIDLIHSGYFETEPHPYCLIILC